MKRFILARLKGKDNFDFSIHSVGEPEKLSWYDPECFWSLSFEKIEDIKFTENGMMGLYFYDTGTLKRKLNELTKSAKIWARSSL